MSDHEQSNDVTHYVAPVVIPDERAVTPYMFPGQVQLPSASPGWYPDHNSGRMRWWDGLQWTERFAPLPVPQARKESSTAYVLAIFLGGFGAYLFYLGRTGSAVTMLMLTLIGAFTALFVVGFFIVGAVWIWLIVDLFLIPSYVRQANTPIAQR